MITFRKDRGWEYRKVIESAFNYGLAYYELEDVDVRLTVKGYRTKSSPAGQASAKCWFEKCSSFHESTHIDWDELDAFEEEGKDISPLLSKGFQDQVEAAMECADPECKWHAKNESPEHFMDLLPKSYRIKLNVDVDGLQSLETVFHELCHVRQMASGHLSGKGHWYRGKWWEEDPYDSPYEQQARDEEFDVGVQWMSNESEARGMKYNDLVDLVSGL